MPLSWWWAVAHAAGISIYKELVSMTCLTAFVSDKFSLASYCVRRRGVLHSSCSGSKLGERSCPR